MFVRGLRRTICNIEEGRQLVKASGSVGADYLEANEALSKKDVRVRVRISRNEAKEGRDWLRLVDTYGNDTPERERQRRIAESPELMQILGSILQRSE